jgi:dolichyldiphosphatase
MPSTHSTALTFYWVYLLPMIPSLTPIVIRSLGSVSRHLASLLARLPLLEGSARVLEQPIQLAALNRGYPSFGSTLLGAGLTGLWAAGLWSRVELGYHTPQQVFAGAALGAVLAPAWALAWVNNPDLGAVVQRSIDMVWEEVVGRVLG